MSKENEDIKEQLGKFAGQYGPPIVLPATVTAINNNNTIAIEFSSGKIVEDCRLKSVVKDGTQFLLIPKTNSVVLVARIESSEEYVVCAYDEITDLKLKIGSTELKINDEGFLLKKQNENLQKLMLDLITAIKNLKFTTNQGPTINLINIADFLALEPRVKDLLKDN